MKINRFKIWISNHPLLIFSATYILGVVLLAIQHGYSFPSTLALCYFPLIFVWKIPVETTLQSAIFALLLCVAMLIFNQDDLAETAAILLYYLLVISVVQEMILLKSEKA